MKLDSIRTAILSDSISFELAAKTFSTDPKSSINGGKMVEENTGSLYFEKDQLKPSDYAMLKDMKVGEISTSFESLDSDGKQVIFKIIKLEEIIPSHTADIDRDFVTIQNYAHNLAQQEAIRKFTEEKQKATFIRIDEMFRDCPFESKGWLK